MKIVRKIVKGIAFLLLFAICALVLDYLRLNIQYLVYKHDYKDAFPVYGNTNQYVPQGMCYSDQYNVVLQTSYHGEHDVSMLYVIDFQTGELLKSLQLKDMNGNNQTHHVGGIATDNQTVWITNDYEVEEYSLDEIFRTEDNQIQSLRTVTLPIRGDFCSVHENTLWIGDFYLKHIYDVPNGNPLLMGYSLENDLTYDIPEVVLSLPKMVQGLTFNNQGQFVFTESYTYLILSNFSIYQNVLEEPAKATIKIHDKEIPYYQLNKSNLVQTIKMPPMAEGLFYFDGSYYILFESSTDHYPLALPRMKKVVQYKTDKS